MSGKTYKTRAIVLRKTKLSEKDAIVTLLDESGALLRAVAKGARKPGGSYASRLELFTTADLVCAKGRNLDIITAATIADGSHHDRGGLEQVSCCSVLAELLAALAQEDLPHERLFEMSHSAFGRMLGANPQRSLAFTCAALLKAFAYTGFRPSFDSCVLCAEPLESHEPSRVVSFSIAEGGFICSACPKPSDAFNLETETLRWANALMRSRFDDIEAFNVPTDQLFSTLQLIGQWSRVHVGRNLKSIDFLLTCGLF